MSPLGSFHIGVSSDFRRESAGLLDPVLCEQFEPLRAITYDFDLGTGEIAPDRLGEYDAVISSARARYTADSLWGVERLAVISRWGVGYDMVDVEACTGADVLLAIATDAVRKPVAEAILTLFLALAKRLPAKDRLVRTGRWDLKAQFGGLGLQGKTVGSVGLGNIAREMFRLLRPFDLGRMLAYDPYASEAAAASLHVELVDLPRVFRDSDFVAINCPLNDQTRGMIDARLLSLMKPTAYLVNTARGPILNQDHLVTALQSGQLAGAGLDVFDPEPLPAGHPLVRMENVILAPHALAWTDDLYRGNGTAACQNVLTVLQGQVPQHTVNPEVVERPGFRRKLRALRRRWEAWQDKEAGR